MDSNSRMPWFGLNLSLPKPSARRKTLETIQDTAPEQSAIATAELREPQETVTAPSAPVRSLLPKWFQSDKASIPIPDDAPQLDPEEIIELEGPREEFR